VNLHSTPVAQPQPVHAPDARVEELGLRDGRAQLSAAELVKRSRHSRRRRVPEHFANYMRNEATPTAEVLTGAVERLTGLGRDRDPPRLMREIERALANREPPRPPITPERLCRACAALREYERRWSRLSVGQSLALEWPA
jgi:hypothetical protein